MYLHYENLFTPTPQQSSQPKTIRTTTVLSLIPFYNEHLLWGTSKQLHSFFSRYSITISGISNLFFAGRSCYPTASLLVKYFAKDCFPITSINYLSGIVRPYILGLTMPANYVLLKHSVCLISNTFWFR